MRVSPFNGNQKWYCFMPDSTMWEAKSGIKDKKARCQYEWGETEKQKRMRWKAWRYYDTVCPLLHASIAFIEYILCMHSLNISLGPHIIKQITQKHHITATSNTIQDCVVFLNCGLSILSIERNKKKSETNISDLKNYPKA